MLPNSLISSTTYPKAQFKAIILCGYGSDLYPLIEPVSTVMDSQDEDDDEDDDMVTKEEDEKENTGAGGDGRQVKALLPLVGKKMIDWVVERVEEAGVFDILVLSPASLSSPISHHLRARKAALASSSSSTSSNNPSTKIELEPVPDRITRQGTVQLLKWAHQKGHVKTDFILLPCDLLLAPNPTSNLSLASLLDRHRSDDNLMTTMFYERAAGNVLQARKDGPGEILTIYDRKNSILLDVREMDDYDDDEVPIRTSLLNKYPAAMLSTNLLPTQLFIFSSLILPVLISEQHSRRIRHMETIREFAGWVSRLAWRKGGQEAIGYRQPHLITREDGLAMGRSTTELPSGTRFRTKEEGAGGVSNPHTGANTPALVSRTSWLRSGSVSNGPGLLGGNEWDLSATSSNKRNNRAGTGGCKIVIFKTDDGFCARGNTVQGYIELNRTAVKLLPPLPPATNTPSGVFISPDSWLHPTVNPNLGEKVGVKKCVIGKGCFVGKMSKLTNVVLMDGVHIGENCKLENCVVSTDVQIRDRASLKDCEIGRGYIVEADCESNESGLSYTACVIAETILRCHSYDQKRATRTRT